MKLQFNSFNNIYKGSAISAFGLNKLSYPNLAPLAKDTVSFTGRSELVATDMTDAPSPYNCFKAEINAEPAAHYLEKVLERYIQPLTVKPKDKKAEKPLDAELSTRIKTSTSIREKVVSKHAKLYRKEHKAFVFSFLSQLNKNFELKKNVTAEDVYTFIKQITKNDNNCTKYSPYANVPYMVDSLLIELSNCEIIDIENMDSQEYRTKKRAMIDVIESSYKSELIDENG